MRFRTVAMVVPVTDVVDERLDVDRENYKGRVTALPKREDIQLPVNEQLIVELYSK